MLMSIDTLMKQPMQFDDNTLFVVDVCGTLFTEDTTLGLLRYHFDRVSDRRFRKLLFKACTTHMSPIRFGFIALEFLSGKHWLKYAAVKLLNGDHLDSLHESARLYAAHLIATKKIPSIWRLLESSAPKKRILLASASLEPVVASLAGKMGARYVASQLEQNDGILSGHYHVDITGSKAQAILNKYGPAALDGHVCAISDNFSDRALLENVGKAIVVLGKKHHQSRWPGMNALFLNVDG